MHLYLGAHTSQAFWRAIYPESRKPVTTEPAPRLREACAYNAADILSLAPPWIESRIEQDFALIDAIVFDRSQKRESKKCTTSVWSKPLPQGSFCNLKNGASVSSPCFTFLQMAVELPLVELVAYGNELCGIYSFDRLSPRGMRQRTAPLTSTEELARYVERAAGLPGAKRARQAVPYLLDNAASPMETLDAMLLYLPYRHGGYGLHPPTMNLAIELDEHAAQIAMKQLCKADLCWTELRLIIEHQGLYDHSAQESYSADRARINGLKAHGFEVIELTGAITHNLMAFEEIALRIAERQRKRIPDYALGATAPRNMLRKSLFSWNAHDGSLP